MSNNLLITIVGPTAVGKTSLCVELAEHYKCDIVSADSRQFYKELSIGTAKPTREEMKGITHHFIDFLPIEKEMSAGTFEVEARKKISELYKKNNKLILTGGSGLYIKALTEGMSEMPTPPAEIRTKLMLELETDGLEHLVEELQLNDPEYFSVVDKNNHQRIVRALEMIRFTGKPFSSFRTGYPQKREFNVIKIGLELERDQLYERINNRVDQMMEQGLLDEVKLLIERKHLNALQTVGYKEFFNYLEGEYDQAEAIRLVKRNTRRYAKRQMTWFKKDEEITWFSPFDTENIINFIDSTFIG